MKTKAKELKRADIFRMHLYGQVIAVNPIAGGKRVKIKISLEDQGRRTNRGSFSGNFGDLEFTDEGHVLEFICPVGRLFSLIDDWRDNDPDREDEPIDPDPVDDPIDPDPVVPDLERV